MSSHRQFCCHDFSSDVAFIILLLWVKIFTVCVFNSTGSVFGSGVSHFRFCSHFAVAVFLVSFSFLLFAFSFLLKCFRFCCIVLESAVAVFSFAARFKNAHFPP